MNPTEIHQTIVGQIDHMRPDDLSPGRDVGAMPVDSLTVLVICPATDRLVAIRYDEGWDEYVVSIGLLSEGATPESVLSGLDEQTHRLICTDLGPAVFGERAKPWTMPLVTITDADGNIIEQF